MRLFIIFISSLLPLLAGSGAYAGNAPGLDSDKARQSYSAGYRAVASLQRQGKEAADLAALLRGALDALAGTPQLDAQEMQALLKGLEPDQPAHGVRDELTPIRAAQTFLTENAGKPGVKSLPSGLQYKVLQAGSGETPQITDTVVVHYRGSKVDGTEIDSSYLDNKPATYRVDEVMPGWAEALQLMPEGSEWELYIPSKLAFGKRGALENQALIYRIKLLAVIADETVPQNPHPATSQD